ncbi:MAG: dUTP diphosphatase [Ruminiclostridium sp.]|nr:dUTP diphosphatase [Ruminiclostridium sp.]
MNIKVKKMNINARIPFRATEGSAGCDLYACLDKDEILAPGERKLIPTGIAIEIPYSKSAGFVFPRSSVSSKYGVSLSNCVGVIDSDYRGEVKVPLINHSSEPYTIRNGDRIAQLVVMPVIDTDFVEADELSETQRGSGGFGSTGK